MKFMNVKYVETDVTLDDFTDNTDATGKASLNALPIGALVLGWAAKITTAFAGTTSATMQIGITGDLDRFGSLTTNSVSTVNKVRAALAIEAVGGTGADAAVTPLLTVTDTKATSPDFGDFSAGAAKVRIYYIDTDF